MRAILFSLPFLFDLLSALATQPLPPCVHLIVRGGGSLNIEQTNRYEIFPQVAASKKGDKLDITLTNGVTHQLKVRDLKSITFTGDAKVTCLSPLKFSTLTLHSLNASINLKLVAEELNLHIQNSSKATLEGQVDSFVLKARESAHFQGLGLSSERAEVDLAGDTKSALGRSKLLQGAAQSRAQCIHLVAEDCQLSQLEGAKIREIPDWDATTSPLWKTRAWMPLDIRREVEPYLLPYDHPIRATLDQMLSVAPRPNSSKRIWSKRFRRNFSRSNLVAADPRFEGHLLKSYTDDVKLVIGKNQVPPWKFLLERRLKGALAINEYLESHPLCGKYIAPAPRKWLFPLPKIAENTSMNAYIFSRYFGHPQENEFVLVAEFHDIRRDQSGYASATRNNQREENIAIRNFIEDLKIGDAHSNNFCRDIRTGKWILVDTESVFELIDKPYNKRNPPPGLRRMVRRKPLGK